MLQSRGALPRVDQITDWKRLTKTRRSQYFICRSQNQLDVLCFQKLTHPLGGLLRDSLTVQFKEVLPVLGGEGYHISG